MTTNPHFGSSFDDWLKEQGIYEEVTTHAVKRVLAWQIGQVMKAEGISKAEWPGVCTPAGRSLTGFWTRKTTRCSSTPCSVQPPQSGARSSSNWRKKDEQPRGN
jgi:hypothetical protein